MSGAENHHSGRGQDRFDEDFEFAAADQAAFGHRVFGQVEGHDPGFFFPNDVLSSRPDLGFDASAADGSQDRSVVPNQHFGGLKTGNRTPDLDDCRQGRLTSRLAQTLDFIEDINFHKALSLTYLLTLLARVS